MSTDIKSFASDSFIVGRSAGSTNHFIPVIALGAGLGLFLAISYVLCVIAYVFFPQVPIEHSALSILLPGFKLLSWTSFCWGLIESLAWGWYIALVFGPIYNFFAARAAPSQ